MSSSPHLFYVLPPIASCYRVTRINLSSHQVANIIIQQTEEIVVRYSYTEKLFFTPIDNKWRKAAFPLEILVHNDNNLSKWPSIFPNEGRG